MEQQRKLARRAEVDGSDDPCSSPSLCSYPPTETLLLLCETLYVVSRRGSLMLLSVIKSAPQPQLEFHVVTTVWSCLANFWMQVLVY